MNTYIIKCTRCDGAGRFEGFGTCFKCNGSGQNEVSEKQYKVYTKKRDGATSSVMFNKVTGVITNLLDKDIERCKIENITLPFNGVNVPVSKIELDNENYIAVRFSQDWRGIMTQLVKLYNKKQGKEITEEQAKSIVDNY